MIAAVAFVAGCLSQIAPSSPTLTIGDKAPALKVESWIRGDRVTSFSKGQVYVVEFWATWCGPCVEAFPHVSALADKYKGKAAFISVNSWDYGNGGQESTETRDDHVNRIRKFVEAKKEVLRTRIALDNSLNRVAHDWMTAAKRDTIPCAFIVNGDSRIAWIGHPEELAEPLQQVVSGTWNLDAFRVAFQEAQREKERADALLRMVEKAARAKNMADFETAMAQMAPHEAIYAAIAANPEFGLEIIQKHRGKLEAIRPTLWCAMCADAAEKAKVQKVKQAAISACQAAFEALPENQAALGALYLARCHFANSDRDNGNQWIEKGRGWLDKYEPKEQRAGLEMYFSQTIKKYGGLLRTSAHS